MSKILAILLLFSTQTYATFYGDPAVVKSGGTGVTSIAALVAELNLFTSSLQGVCPASGGGTTNFLRADGSWAAPSGGSGTVTTMSVVTANGFQGSVANATTTPAVTLQTSVTSGSILKVSSGALVAATSGTDYLPATTGSSIQKANGSGGLTAAVSATDYAPATTGTSILKASSGGFTAATSGTDYQVPLTFSTGLTNTTNTITVNASQNISILSNLTTNGYMKTAGGVGNLSVQSTPLPVADITFTNQALTTCTTSRTVDWSAGNSFTLLLTNSDTCAITFSNATSGQVITIDYTQPASTGSAVVSYSTTVKWAGGTAPTMSTGGSATDSCTFKYNGTDYRGSCVQNLQ